MSVRAQAIKATARCVFWRCLHAAALAADRRVDRFGDARLMTIGCRCYAMERWVAAADDLAALIGDDEETTP